MSAAYYRMETVHGYPLDEVVSALQKAVRRSHVDEAMWWAVELNVSGMGGYCWRRLMVICEEDIGPADPQAAVLINALYQMSNELRKAQPGPAAEKANREWESEPLMHATWYLAATKKNRELPDGYSTIKLRMERGERLEVPDYALDGHTARGRSLGRLEGYFQRVGRVVEPETVVDGNRWGVAFQNERPRERDE